MTILTNLSIPMLSPPLVAQTDLVGFTQTLIPEAINFGKAFLILIIGWIVATIMKGIVKKSLKSTDIDNKIAGWVGGQQGSDFPIENWIGEITCWIIRLFAVVAFLNALQLDAVSEPLNQLLGKFTSFLPRLLGAAAWLGLAWVIATLSKILLTNTFEQFNLDQKLGQVNEENQIPLSQTISNAVYWFIFLLFLPGILSTLQLEGTLVPVQSLLNDLLGILPNVFGAVILGGVGWVIAQIVRQVVTNLLAATGVDQMGSRFGINSEVGGQSLSQILGSIVYILVLIPTAIIALDALQIKSISQPATDMLDQVLALLPKLFAATVILGLAYVAGQYLCQLVSSILASIGFNNLFHWLGIAEPQDTTSPISEEEDSDNVPDRTPSQIAGIVVLVAIMLIATLTAVDILQITSLKTVVGVILAIAGQVFVGLLVFAIGLYLSNLAYNLIASSNTRQSKFLGYTARIAILVLVSAMALQQMGIAPNIVNLAFGLLVGGISVAIALAFGLGGRDVAGEQLRSWLTMFDEENE
ncbi:MAG: mechanosensitive ion channel [Microcystaceae cyanobacterium]